MSKLVRIMWFPVLLSAIYTCWVIWQRSDSSSGAERIERDPMAAYGTRVKILQFYSAKRRIAPGEKALICYGVVNAAKVRLDPPIEKVWPAVSRCFEVSPGTTTRYTLAAEGSDQATVSESFEIEVKR